MSIFPMCLRPWTSFEIDDGSNYFGFVQPCCWAARRVGDTRTQSISEIWNSSEFIVFREHVLSGDIEGYCSPYCPNLKLSSFALRIYFSHLIRKPTYNHLLNLFEIVQGKTALRSSPIHFKISPTLACDLRCIMCFQTHDATAQLSEETITKLLHLLPKAQLIRLQGGEIFASKVGLEFLEQIVTLGRQQPYIGIITNGTFPIERGWKLISLIRLHWIIVSIDAATSSTYQKIRIGGEWCTIIANIKRLCSVRNSHKPRFKVYLSMTLMTLNYHELHDFVKLANNLGADATVSLLTSDPTSDKHLSILKFPHLHDDVHACLIDAISYASKARMRMAQTTLQSVLEILEDSLPR